MTTECGEFIQPEPVYSTLVLLPVRPQPTYIESSGRWMWPLPSHAQSPGCATTAVTASREWWEYVPEEGRPHPTAWATMVRGAWYWVVVQGECE